MYSWIQCLYVNDSRQGAAQPPWPPQCANTVTKQNEKRCCSLDNKWGLRVQAQVRLCVSPYFIFLRDPHWDSLRTQITGRGYQLKFHEEASRTEPRLCQHALWSVDRDGFGSHWLDLICACWAVIFGRYLHDQQVTIANMSQRRVILRKRGRCTENDTRTMRVLYRVGQAAVGANIKFSLVISQALGELNLSIKIAVWQL